MPSTKAVESCPWMALEDRLSFERFDEDQQREFDLRDLVIEGSFFARWVTMNYRRIVFDVVAFKGRRRRGGRRRR